MKNTFQRQLILEAAQCLGNHPTPDEIYVYARQRCPSISKGTVYRNIGVLEREGVLRRIEMANAQDRVDCTVFPHYHFRCEACGRVFDVDMPVQSDILDRIPNKNGFVFTGHDITFCGLCPACAAKNGR